MVHACQCSYSYWDRPPDLHAINHNKRFCCYILGPLPSCVLRIEFEMQILITCFSCVRTERGNGFSAPNTKSRRYILQLRGSAPFPVSSIVPRDHADEGNSGWCVKLAEATKRSFQDFVSNNSAGSELSKPSPICSAFLSHSAGQCRRGQRWPIFNHSVIYL